jgi:KDO2-lipid IV(A) lauroyltransferase
LQRVIYRVEYILFLFFKFFTTKTPRWFRDSILTGFTNLLYLVIKKYRKIVKKNLEIAFGLEYAEANFQRITKSCIRNLLVNMVIVVENLHRTPQDIEKMVLFENREIIDELLKEGKGLILSSGHFWHWEMLGAIISSQVVNGYGVVEKLKNPLMDSILTSSRERFGITVIPMKGALRKMVKVLKNGKTIFILTDQAVNRGQGIELPFFGKEAIHSEANSFLSKKYDIPILPVFMSEKDGKYSVRFEEPIWANRVENSTAIELKLLEKEIRKRPENWLWCHRRWKNLDIY